MPKLTDTQLAILAAAAQRTDGAVLPLPKSLRVQGGALNSIFKSLLKKGLVSEQSAGRSALTWRKTDDGKRITLVIADVGLKAIKADVGDRSTVRQDDAAQPKKRQATRSRPSTGRKANSTPPGKGARAGTKLAFLIELLSRREGATIAEIVSATKWQPHSVRGAISGALKRKLGLAVWSETVDGRGRVYRIAANR